MPNMKPNSVQSTLSTKSCGNQCSEVSETDSDITIFVKEFKRRIQTQLDLDNESHPFIIFDEMKYIPCDETSWLHDNNYRFFKDTPNERVVEKNFLSELGYICCMTYSPDGNYIITGHSTGMIQVHICFTLSITLIVYNHISNFYDAGTLDCYCFTFVLTYVTIPLFMYM